MYCVCSTYLLIIDFYRFCVYTQSKVINKSTIRHKLLTFFTTIFATKKRTLWTLIKSKRQINAPEQIRQENVRFVSDQRHLYAKHSKLIGENNSKAHAVFVSVIEPFSGFGRGIEFQFHAKNWTVVVYNHAEQRKVGHFPMKILFWR